MTDEAPEYSADGDRDVVTVVTGAGDVLARHRQDGRPVED